MREIFRSSTIGASEPRGVQIPARATGVMGDQLAPTERHAFRHEGRVVYEWDQTLEEVNMYVEVPPGVTAKVLAVRIDSDEVAIGIGATPLPGAPTHRARQDGRVLLDAGRWRAPSAAAETPQGQTPQSLFEGHAALDPARAQQENQRPDAG